MKEYVQKRLFEKEAISVSCVEFIGLCLTHNYLQRGSWSDLEKHEFLQTDLDSERMVQFTGIYTPSLINILKNKEEEKHEYNLIHEKP
jgi:hypothetical protein